MTVKFLPKLRKKSPYLVTLSLGFFIFRFSLETKVFEKMHKALKG